MQKFKIYYPISGIAYMTPDNQGLWISVECHEAIVNDLRQQIELLKTLVLKK